MKHAWKTRLSSLLLAAVMLFGMIPAASAASADFKYTVDADDKVTLDEDDFADFFNAYDRNTKNDTLEYVTFSNVPSFDDYGSFYAYDRSGKKVTLDESDLEDYEFYLDRSNMSSRADDQLRLVGLTFTADEDASSKTLSFRFKGYGEDGETSGYGYFDIKISGDSSSSSSGDITVTVDADDEVSLSAKKFKTYFEKKSDEDFSYLYFDEDRIPSKLDDYGHFSSKNRRDKTVSLTASKLASAQFYYDADDVSANNEYTLDDLVFVAEKDASSKTLSLPFSAVGDSGDKVKGTLVIKVSGSSGSKSDSSSTTKKGDINYVAEPKKQAQFDPDDFNAFYQKKYSGDMLYVRFTDSTNLKNTNGKLYYRYDKSREEVFDADGLEDYTFYYDKSDIPDDDTDCYPLSELSFVASSTFDGSVTLDFTVYKSSSKKASGTLVISSEDTADSTVTVSSVRYYVSGSSPVQINANDIARSYSKNTSGGTLQTVDFLSVPASGALYYNYYGSGKTQLTSKTCSNQTYYRSPSAGQYDLNSLTYVPSGTNYCATILYNAKGTAGSVLGSLLISVTKSAVSEVYGVTPKNTAVTLPASSIYNVVYSATGTALDSIQLLELPAATVGSVTCSDGYLLLAADTSTKYSYSSSGSRPMSQLKFTPASNYTGSVEIPYLAYDKNGTAIAAGKFCLGVVSTRKTFSDISSSTWCYKYVTELSSAGVIDGYSNGTFKEKNAITYGAALKLIMLAAGYPEQAKTGTHVFSGYLARAQADGLVSGNVDLSKPITRLQVSQLAAKAMKLSTSNLSSVKPFTDTDDLYVQALNAAGIVEGYFSNGSSTFKPGNTLTRGQVSAIVWRMRNYNK